MKTRGFGCLAAVVVLLSLCACAGPEITAMDVAMEQARAEIERQQVVTKAEADRAEYEMLAQLPPETAGIAYMGKQMRELVAAVMAKDQRRPAGFYDMKTAVAQSQNAMVDKTIGRVVTLTTAGTAMFVAGDVIKHGQDKIGDRINAGEGSTVEFNRISSKSKTDTNQLGDNNSTGAVDASTTGPDKSSTVTEIAAPEEPVVEEPEVEAPEEPSEPGEFVPTEPPDFPDGPVEIPGPESAE